MNEIKYYHFSDCHIDQLNTLTSEYKEQMPIFSYEILKRIEYVIDSAIKNKIPLIVFSGDMFKDSFSDFKVKNKIIRKLVEIIKKWSDAWIKIILISWNHDCSINSKKNITKEHLLEIYDIIWYENVIVSAPLYNEITKHTVSLNDWQVIDIVLYPYLQDEYVKEDGTIEFFTKEQAYEKLKSFISEKKDYPMIMVWHFDVIWAKINNWNKMKEDLSSLNKNPNIWNKTELYSLVQKKEWKGFDSILLGHYHEYQDIFDLEQNKEIETDCVNKVYYAWSTQRISFWEEWQIKGFVEWTLTDENWKIDFSKKHIEIADRNWITLKIIVPDETQDVNDFILSELKKKNDLYKDSIVRVIIEISQEKMAIVIEEPLKEYLKNKWVFIIKNNSFSYQRTWITNISNNKNQTNWTEGINQKIAITPFDVLDEYLFEKSEDEKKEYKELLEIIVSEIKE